VLPATKKALGLNVLKNSTAAMSCRCVFLDRDGVINRTVVRNGKPYPPARLEDLEILPGVPEALAALREAGYLLIVVTNQPDVTRGTQTREVVDAMHAHLMAVLPLDEIKVCFGTSSETSDCYKPRPGMLLDAAQHYKIALNRSYIVGDRWRDVGAGQAAGTFTIFIDYDYQERRPDSPDATVSSLQEAASLILSNALEKSRP
jgi:D-glycero-D-manno-heptose 1,7-bisphosphate phosphatase